jgi:cytochrome oxidase assembly protein ShyY1
MRRVPILSTFVVALAVTAMVALGFWQISRAHWKEALLASYRAAATAPPLYGLPGGMPADYLAFRRADVLCRVATAPTQIGGANAKGTTGFRNIVGCTLIDGRQIMADLGWSPVGAKPRLPAVGQRVAGVGPLIPDHVLAGRVLGDRPRAMPFLLVFETAVPGLEPSVPPSIDMIPNNHRSYAVQWFLFAAIAVVIYLLALRKRYRRQ